MIDQVKMNSLAATCIENAPNVDWKNRGGAKLEGELVEHSIVSYDGNVFGTATVGFYKWNNVKKDDFGNHFSGFVLAVTIINGEFYTETKPVIGTHTSKTFRNVACGFAYRFCPKCKEFDSVKQESKVLGPELVEVTYKCTNCDYLDHDMID